MYRLDYHKPKDIGEAGELLSRHDNSKLLAGGMSLLPTLKLRLAQYDDLVDLAAIPDIKGIRLDGGTLTVGAMTRHHDVANSDTVARARSPTPIRRRTIRPRYSASARQSSQASARSRPTTSSSACSRPRSNRTRSSRRCVFRSPRKRDM